jgi:hypothetical protein
MMKVLQARIDWMQQFANPPSLYILVDKMPTVHQYEQRGPLYFGENDGLVNFFAYSKPDQGYGGREFKLMMKDGSIKVLKGPWSSRAAVMNGAGFTPCQEVAITDDPCTWNRGHTFYGSSVTLEVFKQAMALLPEADIVIQHEKDSPKNYRYEIVRKGMTFDQSQAFKHCKHALTVIEKLKNDSTPQASWERPRSENIKAWVDGYNKDVETHGLTKFGLDILTNPS